MGKVRGRQRGLRARLDRVESNAHQTMNSAQGAIHAVKESVLGFMEDLRDGISIVLIRKDNANFMDFLTGKAKEFPLGLRVDFREEEEE